MADGNYILNAGLCGCGSPVKPWSGKGRKPGKCVGCSRPERKRILGPVVWTIKACENCGVMMPPATPSRIKRFCSIQCVGESNRAHHPKPCEECGKVFLRKPGGDERRTGREPKYCSRICYGKALTRAAYDRNPVQKEIDAIVRIGRGIRADERSRRPVESNEDMEARARSRCIKRIIRILNDYLTRVSPRECASCGLYFQPAKRKSRTVCPGCVEIRNEEGRRASRSAYKARRRARLKIDYESVDPIYILSRDKWICQLCGVKTPKDKRGSHDDDAPEVDHIISLAEGGSHTKANLQCACRSCNIKKGAKSFGQMRMG